MVRMVIANGKGVLSNGSLRPQPPSSLQSAHVSIPTTPRPTYPAAKKACGTARNRPRRTSWGFVMPRPMESWFANWGQVGQLVVGLLSLLRRKATRPNGALTVAPAVTTLPVVGAAPPPVALSPGQFTSPSALFMQKSCGVGDFWDVDHGRFVIRRLLKVTPEPDSSLEQDAVEIECIPSIFSRGADVKPGTTSSRHILKECGPQTISQNSIYLITVTGTNNLLIRVLWVSHINSYANTVELQFFSFFDRLPSH